MNIEQLDGTRILISLCEKDLETLDITFEELGLSESHSRRVLKKLLLSASDKTGVEMSGKKIMIEAIQYEHGFILLITLRDKEKRKKYRIKRCRNSYVFLFDSAENMLRCMNALYRMKDRCFLSSVFFCGGRYYLVINSSGSLHGRYIATISEFCSSRRGGSLFASLLLEHGTVLASKNAVEKIGSAINKKARPS